MGKGKDKEFDYQIPSQVMQTELGKISLLPAKIDFTSEKQIKKI